MAHRLTLVRDGAPALLLACVACAPLPPATPAPAEIGALRSRVGRSLADEESVLRLAAGLWSQGNRGAARELLRDASAAVPEASSYVAALAVAAEASGEYEDARTLYLRYLDGSGSSALATQLVGRIDAIRGETAAPLVRRVLESGRPLDHGMDSAFVVAVLPFSPPDGAPDLAGLALATTELLTLGLRSNGPFHVLDWEVSEAARRALNSDPQADVDAGAVGDVLGAQRAIWGRVERLPPDSVLFVVEASWVTASGSTLFAQDSIRASLSSAANVRSRMTRRAFEMLVGAEPGSLAIDFFEPFDVVSTEGLILMGQGLLMANEGDRAGAREQLERARSVAPRFDPLLARIDQLASLDDFDSSPTLPLAEEILGLARRRVATTALRETSAEPFVAGSTRHGVGEAFGLDRLGSQVFLELVIELYGTSP